MHELNEEDFYKACTMLNGILTIVDSTMKTRAEKANYKAETLNLEEEAYSQTMIISALMGAGVASIAFGNRNIHDCFNTIARLFRQGGYEKALDMMGFLKADT